MDRVDKKVCVFIFYYGTLPSYFNIFIKGCTQNSSIDFIFFTDLKESKVLPENVKFVNLSIDDFRKLALKKIRVKIQNDINPYKFCDFRPSFGLLLEEYLNGYDYWGYCDLDMILGDLDSYLQPLLGKYEIINTSTRWIHGPLCFLRNTKEINELFMQSGDFKRVFESHEHFAFDENGGKKALFDSALKKESDFLQLNSSKYYNNVDDIECFTSLVYKNQDKLKIHNSKAILDNLSSSNHAKYISGKILDEYGKSWPCYHWVMEKKLNQFSYPNWTSVPDHFVINRFGFFDSKSVDTLHYKIHIIKRDLIGKIKDARDIIWLARNKKWSSYYNEKYLDSNSSLTHLLKLILHL